jgi:hypothetical protein
LKPAMAGSTIDAMEPERSKMNAISVWLGFICDRNVSDGVGHL